MRQLSRNTTELRCKLLQSKTPFQDTSRTCALCVGQSSTTVRRCYIIIVPYISETNVSSVIFVVDAMGRSRSLRNICLVIPVNAHRLAGIDVTGGY